MLIDVTDTKHVRSRNQARARVESDENNFLPQKHVV